MKKLLLTCALVLGLVAGCASEPKGNALDAAAFSKVMTSADASVVRVYVTTEEVRNLPTVDAKANVIGETTVDTLNTAIKGLSLTESESQDRIYGDPHYFVEINRVIDEDYMKLTIYADTLVVATADEFVNYALTSDTYAALAGVFEGFIAE